MKIGDQKPLPPTPDGVEGAGAAAEPAGGADFSEKLEEVSEGDSAAEAVPPSDLEALAARIEAGEISPTEAMQQLVEQVLDAQLGPGAPSAVRAQAREFVENALTEDPHLASLTKRLGGSS